MHESIPSKSLQVHYVDNTGGLPIVLDRFTFWAQIDVYHAGGPAGGAGVGVGGSGGSVGATNSGGVFLGCGGAVAGVDDDDVEGGGDGIKSSRNPGMKGVMRSRVSFHNNCCSSSRESAVGPSCDDCGGGTRTPDACITSTRFLIDSGTASNSWPCRPPLCMRRSEKSSTMSQSSRSSGLAVDAELISKWRKDLQRSVEALRRDSERAAR